MVLSATDISASSKAKPTSASKKSEILERNLFQFMKYVKYRCCHKNPMVPGGDIHKDATILASPKTLKPSKFLKPTKQQHATWYLYFRMQFTYKYSKHIFHLI